MLVSLCADRGAMRFCATVQAGTALKLISGSVPLVSGLADFAGAALRAGDRLIQTRRLEKVTIFSILPVRVLFHNNSHAYSPP